MQCLPAAAKLPGREGSQAAWHLAAKFLSRRAEEKAKGWGGLCQGGWKPQDGGLIKMLTKPGDQKRGSAGERGTGVHSDFLNLSVVLLHLKDKIGII